MTDMEKKVMIRLCAKIVAETDLYETDKEVQNMIDWVCLSEQIRKVGEAIRQEVLELSATNHLLKEQTELLAGDKEKLLCENEKLEKQQKKL